MQEDQKQRLKQLLEQQKQRIYNAKINEQKERILRSVRLDISQFPIWHVIKSFKDINDHFNVWICFLSGSPELFELYPYGDIQNFINDFESWQYISPYLILVCDNFKDFIFIDDEKKIIRSQNA